MSYINKYHPICYTTYMIIAVDTGGTKTLVAAFSKSGAIIASTKFPTPIDQLEYVGHLVETIRNLCKDTLPEIISVALPDIKSTSLVPVFSNLPWTNFDVIKALRPFFPTSIRIIVANDAKLGGLGEVRSMLIAPKRALYVTISTGIGTGFVVNGKLSKDLASAEGGHIILEHDGVFQIWEQFASGKAIYTTYGKLAQDIHSKHAWREINKRFLSGFLVLIPVLEPDMIIIGGSIGVHFEKYGTTLEALVNEKLSPTTKRPKFIQASHPEQAVIYGCYYHALDTINAH
jgi:predicted NBD/HSP70 family sugar kinase